MKKYLTIAIIGNVLMLGLIFSYIYLREGKSIWHQTIADRYYYHNLFLSKKSDGAQAHISKLLSDDLIAIGSNKINIQDFSDSFQYTSLCVAHSMISKDRQRDIFRQKVSDENYKLIEKALIKISQYCKTK